MEIADTPRITLTNNVRVDSSDCVPDAMGALQAHAGGAETSWLSVRQQPRRPAVDICDDRPSGMGQRADGRRGDDSHLGSARPAGSRALSDGQGGSRRATVGLDRNFEERPGRVHAARGRLELRESACDA